MKVAQVDVQGRHVYVLEGHALHLSTSKEGTVSAFHSTWRTEYICVLYFC